MKKQLVFAAVFSIIIFGFGSPNSAFAIGGIVPIDITSLGDEVGLSGKTVSGATIETPDQAGDAPVALGAGAVAAILWATMTPSDLGVDSVGTLPTSPLYFLKEWKRGLTRLFTFGAIAKAELELNITNQMAAEVLEVAKAYDACAANALGGGKSCKPEDEVGAVKNALQNFTDAQERLRFRITTINGTSNVTDSERFLKQVDEKTAKHAVLLEQVSTRVTFTRTGNCGALSTFCQQYEELQSSVDIALDNTLKTFTITVTEVNDAPSLKQKAEEQIKRAGIAIVTVDVVSPTGGEDSLKVTVPKQTQGATFGEKTRAPSSITGKEMMDAITATGVDDASADGNQVWDDTDIVHIFDRWGNSIAKAKSHLADAKKAFAEGKYGEAYGLARSAEAIATGINGTRDMDNQAAGKEYGNKTAPASPETSSKEKVKIIENESPRPSDREKAPAATTTPEREKTETAEPSGDSAGSASNSGRDN